MQREMVLQTLLRFQTIKEPHRPKRMSLTVEERTQTNSNKEHRSSHNTLTTTQWIRTWSIDSSSHLQITHLFANTHPLFLNMIHGQYFVVTSLPCKKKKKNTLLKGAMNSKWWPRGRELHASILEWNKKIW